MNKATKRDPAALHDDFIKVWGNPRGWRALTIVNHTAIGIRFMVTGGVFFLIGGLMAMLMRTQLALPEQTFIGPILYDQLFHSGLAIIMTALQARRISYGYVGKAAPYEVAVVAPWWLYTACVFWFSFSAIVLLPGAWGGF